MINDLARRFTQLQVPRSEWTHAAHLAVGLWHIRALGPAEALDRLRTGIRQLNDAHGTANTSESGYHETITCAYVQLLAEFLEQFSEDISIDQILDELLASPLARRDALLTFYSRDLLHSPAARRDWKDPDLAPLGLIRLSNP